MISVCRAGSLVLYRGITLAIFSLLGTMPVRKDLLNILANWFTICGAICLTMCESILSNPVDFFDLL